MASLFQQTLCLTIIVHVCIRQKELPELFLKQGKVRIKEKEQERKRRQQRQLGGDKENIMYNV